jgi:precorrin-2 dehydrogenase/sirohydrochlorin ferrochelatase
MTGGLPILLDVRTRTIVIVGGGKVAARKARSLLEAAASDVTVVSPAFDASMPAGVKRVAARYDRSHLAGATLVFAATDSAEVNEQVVRDAAAIGALVNRADRDDESPGDFTTLATRRAGAITVAVSGGGTPGVATAALAQAVAAIDPRLVSLAAAMQTLRPTLRDCGAFDASSRAAMFRSLLEDAALDVVHRGGAAGLAAWLKSRHPELAGVSLEP